MKKFLSAAVAVAAVAVIGGTTAFAVGTEGFGYLIGRERSTSRNELYSEAETLPEEEQDGFLAENGIGEEPYSEEAAAGYSFVTGQANGSQYENDGEDTEGYSYLVGQKRGSSYQR